MFWRLYLFGNLGPLGCLRCLGEEKKGRCQNKEEGNDQALKVRHAHEHQLSFAVTFGSLLRGVQSWGQI